MFPSMSPTAISVVNLFLGKGFCVVFYARELDAHYSQKKSFTGSAGVAVISRNSAYLVTDSRYWLQAEDELDNNWNLIRAPIVDGFRDWQSFLLSRVQEGTRIGLDARMISWSKASALNTAVS